MATVTVTNILNSSVNDLLITDSIIMPYQSEAQIPISYSKKAPRSERKRKDIEISKSEWGWALAFMLCMSATGLRFPLGYIALPLILVSRYIKDRYAFLVALTIALGGYGMTDLATTFKYSLTFLIVPVGILGMIILKKPPILRKAVTMFFIYMASLFALALLSEEVMSIQLRGIFQYTSIAYFSVPFVVFAGKDFDIEEFWRKTVPYIVIISIFYVLDAFVVCGSVFLPTCYSGVDGLESTFWDLYMRPFSMNFVRKWPMGMLLFSLILLPSLKYFRLKKWMWVVIILALAGTKTFTVISGMLIAGLLLRGTLKQCLAGLVGLIVLVPTLYVIDEALPTSKVDITHQSSALRVKSSIDQVFELQEAQSDEELAEFGSGRIGQIFPRFDFLFEKNREWIGLGFLDVNNSTDPQFLIYDEFANNPWDAWRPATRIEITPLQVIISIGFIGFAIVTLFYLGLASLLWKLKYKSYFYCILFLYGWYGLSDFGGFVQAPSLLVIGLAFSAVVMTNRPKRMDLCQLSDR